MLGNINPMKKIGQIITAITLTSSIVLTSGCGYLLYPERNGLTSGKLDSTIILLDGLGLLFGVIPGVIAFAVDITNGNIYLAPGERSAVSKHISSATPVSDQTLTQDGLDPHELATRVSAKLGFSVAASDIQYYWHNQQPQG